MSGTTGRSADATVFEMLGSDKSNAQLSVYRHCGTLDFDGPRRTGYHMRAVHNNASTLAQHEAGFATTKFYLVLRSQAEAFTVYHYFELTSRSLPGCG